MSWHELERAAPEIAERGRERLARARVALLGTLRADGSPRISPIEPYFADGELVLGAMAWSAKARDLLRDPRCSLHSAIAAPDAGEAELKLYGRAAAAGERLRAACGEAWWVGRPAASALVFSLLVDEAVLVEWELEAGAVSIRSWSPSRGVRRRRRGYP